MFYWISLNVLQMKLLKEIQFPKAFLNLDLNIWRPSLESAVNLWIWKQFFWYTQTLGNRIVRAYIWISLWWRFLLFFNFSYIFCKNWLLLKIGFIRSLKGMMEKNYSGALHGIFHYFSTHKLHFRKIFFTTQCTLKILLSSSKLKT